MNIFNGIFNGIGFFFRVLIVKRFFWEELLMWNMSIVWGLDIVFFIYFNGICWKVGGWY